MLRTFFPPRVSDPDMHHGTCVTHVPLTGCFLWRRWLGKRDTGIRGAYASHNFTYLARGPCVKNEKPAAPVYLFLAGNWTVFLVQRTPDSKVHGAHMGPIWGQTAPRWAPCWCHGPCYLGLPIYTFNPPRSSKSSHINSWKFYSITIYIGLSRVIAWLLSDGPWLEPVLTKISWMSWMACTALHTMH